jgi:flagellar motor switch protein FliN
MDEREELEQTIDSVTEAVAVEAARLDELEARPGGGRPLGMDHLRDVLVTVTVQVGRARLPLAEIAALAPGSLVPLDREAHEPVDLLVGDKIVGRGEIVTVDGCFGLRVTHLLAGGDP